MAVGELCTLHWVVSSGKSWPRRLLAHAKSVKVSNESCAICGSLSLWIQPLILALLNLLTWMDWQSFDLPLQRVRGRKRATCFAEFSLLSLQKDGTFEEAVSRSEVVRQQLRQADESVHGSPLVLIITPSAVSANKLAKKLPRLNQV